jgi:hypothetical protein
LAVDVRERDLGVHGVQHGVPGTALGRSWDR